MRFPGANNNCVNAGIDCTRDEMAANDIFLWFQQAAATLPNEEHCRMVR